MITGRVGAGKSTLLMALLGLTCIDDGTILWNGQGLTNPAEFFTPPRTAYTMKAKLMSYSYALRDEFALASTIFSSLLIKVPASFETGTLSCCQDNVCASLIREIRLNQANP